MDLKPHQERIINEYERLRSSGERFRRCVTSSTGTGKSYCMTSIAESEVAKGGRVVLYSIRRLLTDQFIKQLQRDGISFGCRAAEFDEHVDEDAPVQICSMQTELARVLRKRKKQGLEGDIARRMFPLSRASLVILDEAHLLGADTACEVVNEHVELGANVLGFSATPFGCGHMFDSGGLIFGADASEGRDSGLIVPCYMKSCPEMDTTQIEKVKTSNGDWSEADIRKYCWTQAIYGYVFESMVEFNPEMKPFFLFAPGVEESVGFESHFRKQGIRVAHIDATDIVLDGSRYPSNRDVRRSVLREHEEGAIKGITNRWVLREAVDAPWCEFLSLATPFGSLTTYLQVTGRALRASPKTEKEYCIVEGSLVLTERGLVPIEKVCDDDRLWDGVSWVCHQGVICNGEKEVITYAGLTATPDHVVYTRCGRRTLGECARLRLPIAKTGVGGKEIRYGFCFVGDDQGEEKDWPQAGEEGICGNNLREVREGFLGLNGEFAGRKNEGMSPMQSAKAFFEIILPEGYGCQGEVREEEQGGMEGLWRARDQVCLQECLGCLSMDIGQYRPSVRWPGTGSNRQRWRLRSREFEVVKQGAKSVTHKEVSSYGEVSQISEGSSGCSICGFNIERDVVSWNDGRRNMQEMGTSVMQTKRRVWDILNAGPLHRFTVNGLLVSNCTILDHGGNAWRFGSPNADRHHIFAEYFDDPDGARIAKEARLESIRQEKEECPIACPKCGSVQLAMKTGLCYNCNHDLRGKSKRFVIQRDGQLIEVTGLPVKPRKQVKSPDMMDAWARAYWASKRKGGKLYGHTFAQLRGMIASGNFGGFEHLRGQWVAPTVALTPKDPATWFRKTCDVPSMMLNQ